jgi:polyisoprenoid-binding protein YceI
MRLQALAFAPLCFALFACDNNPAEGKAVATVNEAVTPPPAASSTGAAKLTFSHEGSKLEFVGAKVTGKHDGSFGVFSGTIDWVDANPEKSTVKVEIDTKSIRADNPKLTTHLMTPDLLDVEKYPKASFESTSIKAGGEGGATHTLTGNFTLHGVTKSISFPAKVNGRADGADVDAEFAINRKDFGITYPGMPDDLIKDEVLIKLQIRAKQAG